MRIAVTSQNFKTITGHAGKSRRFLIYDLEPGSAPQSRSSGSTCLRSFRCTNTTAPTIRSISARSTSS